MRDGRYFDPKGIYAPLYAIINYTFGKNNSNSYFRIPDYRGRFIRCVGKVYNPNGSLQGDSALAINSPQNEGLPNITGDFKVYPSAGGGGFANGAFSMTNNRYDSATRAASADNWSRQYDFNASRSSPIYGRSSHVIVSNYSVYYYIRAL